MKRTQLYVDDDLWHVLHARARQERTTISELMRRAARERYMAKLDERRKAMQAFVGIRENRSEFRNPEAYIRSLRRSSRIEGLNRA